ncbi:MAG: T9SS C-terminal target domain-containing protein [Bacteroidetes bacterium]|nr:MAG: T9SS C-terminal target domain-containing protein [Bacteroidota bacterium]
MCLAWGTTVVAQSLVPGPADQVVSWNPDMFQRQRTEQVARMASCTQDTVQYGLAKATGLATLSINSATSADQLGQWFDASASNPVTIHGLSFYGFATSAVGAGTLDIVCAVYNAGTDSLPVAGPPLASAQIQVDTNFYGGNLAALQKDVAFATPVTVTGPYVVVVSNAAANSLVMINNSWNNGDGDGEWLGMASIAGNWLHGYDLNIGGVSFDADALLEPHVTFDFTAGFTPDQGCIVADQPASFTNTSDAFITSRFYNLYSFDAYFGFAPQDSTYSWEYGDASQEDFSLNGSHTYSGVQPDYDVTLYAVSLGYSRFCVDSVTINQVVGVAADGDFTFSQTGSQSVSFTDASTGADSWFWDFGDGNTSTQQNPSHTYAAGGTYTVSLVVTSCAGSDTATREVVVFNTGLAAGLDGKLSVFPNPTTGMVTVDLSLNQAEEVRVSVLNLLGQEVRRIEAGTLRDTRLTLNLSGLEASVYLVQVQAGERQETLRINLL